jgi:heme-degrading monooxygenase HmoA
MIQEVLFQTIDPARRDEYVDEFRKAFREANFAGAHEGKILKSVEDPSRVVIVIEWDTVESHTRHRGTPPHNAFRERISAYQTAPTQGAHYEASDL